MHVLSQLCICSQLEEMVAKMETMVAKMYSMHKTVAKEHTFIIDVYHLAGFQGVLMHFQPFTQLQLLL